MSMQNTMAVQPNMEVFTADAVHIGRVKSIQDQEMLIDREHVRDIFIPLSFVTQVIDTEQRVELSITEVEFDELHWENPPII